MALHRNRYYRQLQDLKSPKKGRKLRRLRGSFEVRPYFAAIAPKALLLLAVPSCASLILWGMDQMLNISAGDSRGCKAVQPPLLRPGLPWFPSLRAESTRVANALDEQKALSPAQRMYEGMCRGLNGALSKGPGWGERFIVQR